MHISEKSKIDKHIAWEISDLCYNGDKGTHIWRKYFKKINKYIAELE